MEQKLFKEFDRFAMILFKPDSVELGISEELLSYIVDFLYKNQLGHIQGVFMIEQITRSQVELIYPYMDEDGKEPIIDYLTSGPCVISTFNGKKGILNEIRNLKGKNMMAWTLEELEFGIGLEKSIRGIIPVPGTLDLYLPVKKRIFEYINDPFVRLTDVEFATYCRNLIHTPDDLTEILGLLSIIPERLVQPVLSPRQLNILKKFKSEALHYEL